MCSAVTSVAGSERSILTYNTTSNSWSAKSPMPTTRYAFDCVTLDGAVYLVGGFTRPGGDRRRDRAIRPVRGDMVVSDSPEDSALRTLRGGRGQANHHDGGTTYTPYSPTNPDPFKPADVVEILDTEGL